MMKQIIDVIQSAQGELLSGADIAALLQVIARAENVFVALEKFIESFCFGANGLNAGGDLFDGFVHRRGTPSVGEPEHSGDD